MKKNWPVIVFILLSNAGLAQNVGIGTTTPTEKLEVKNPLRSAVKISSASYNDTSQLILSNRIGNAGTDFLISSRRELGLYFTSTSDLPTYNNDSALVILPTGNIGMGVKIPTTRLQVNGNQSITGFNTLEFGNGLTKELNAGKIGYRSFSADGLDIVGAGTNTTNRKIHFFNEGSAVFEGPVNAKSTLQLNGNPGTSGQVLTSNGVANPTWENAAYSNNIRFSFNLVNNNFAANYDSLNFASTNYNLNPAMVVIVPTNITRLQFNKTGLYHFSGSMEVQSYNHPLTTTGRTYIAYVDYYINDKRFTFLAGAAAEVDGTSNNDYFKTFSFSFDIYLTAGQTLNFAKHIYPGGTTANGVEGHIEGYLVAD